MFYTRINVKTAELKLSTQLIKVNVNIWKTLKNILYFFSEGKKHCLIMSRYIFKEFGSAALNRGRRLYIQKGKDFTFEEFNSYCDSILKLLGDSLDIDSRPINFDDFHTTKKITGYQNEKIYNEKLEKYEWENLDYQFDDDGFSHTKKALMRFTAKNWQVWHPHVDITCDHKLIKIEGTSLPDKTHSKLIIELMSVHKNSSLKAGTFDSYNFW